MIILDYTLNLDSTLDFQKLSCTSFQTQINKSHVSLIWMKFNFSVSLWPGNLETNIKYNSTTTNIIKSSYWSEREI